MAKKGGNRKKSSARKNQKKVVTTPPAIPTTPEESSPVTPVNALNNDKADVLAGSIVQDVTKEQYQIEETKKEDAQVKDTEESSNLSNASEEALASTSENVIESLEVKETLEEPPHVEVKSDTVAVILDAPAQIEQPLVITLEKSVIPEEHQPAISVEPVPEEVLADLPKVETENLPLLQEKKQSQEPVVLVVSESEPSSTEKQQVSTTHQDQSTAVQQIVDEKEDCATIVTAAATAEDEAKPKTKEQLQENEQAISHENEQVPDQKEYGNIVQQATENEAKNVQEPHELEHAASTDVEVASQLPDNEERNHKAFTVEDPIEIHGAAATTQSKQQDAPAAPAVLANDLDQAQIEKENTPLASTASFEKEDTPTVRSQSIFTSINTDVTINDEEIVTPKSSLNKSRGVIGFNKDKRLTKRKSQILSLFKRGGEKTPELPIIQEKKPTTEKKLSKRKSWMFWKSTTAVAGQQKN
ncbi:hypothetical protein BD408DRAFT_410040 [Parasitella parasitica]|nr:hypothetical protein BD408DRAFT_410040 [Parasitella parasitica]